MEREQKYSPEYPNLTEIPVIILVGGYGRRIRDVTGDLIPKPLIKVGQFNLVEYSINICKESDIERFILATSHRAEQVREYFSEGERHEVDIKYSHKPRPAGILEGIKNAIKEHQISSSFIACNGDEIRLGLSISEMFDFHKRKGGAAAMALTTSDEPRKHRVVNLDENSKIIKTVLHPKAGEIEGNLINIGLCIFEPKVIDYLRNLPLQEGWSLLIDKLVEEGELYGFVSDVRYFNVGTKEELDKATRAISS